MELSQLSFQQYSAGQGAGASTAAGMAQGQSRPTEESMPLFTRLFGNLKDTQGIAPKRGQGWSEKMITVVNGKPPGKFDNLRLKLAQEFQEIGQKSAGLIGPGAQIGAPDGVGTQAASWVSHISAQRASGGGMQM